MGCELAARVVERHRRRLGRVRRITIDLDPTDDPTHGAGCTASNAATISSKPPFRPRDRAVQSTAPRAWSESSLPKESADRRSLKTPVRQKPHFHVVHPTAPSSTASSMGYYDNWCYLPLLAFLTLDCEP